MPQTREHLDICRLLGVRAGVVALTKADLLPEPGRRVARAARARTSPRSPRAPSWRARRWSPSRRGRARGWTRCVPRSAGRRRALPRRPAEGPGVPARGPGLHHQGLRHGGHRARCCRATLALEDAVSLLPGLPGPFRVRGLQVARAGGARRLAAGQRTAVNLADVEPEDDPPGHGAGARRRAAGDAHAGRGADACCPPRRRRCPRRRKLLLHLGTAQVEATVALLDLDELAPGETALAQLRLAAPVAALPGQRFILRGSRALPGRGATRGRRARARHHAAAAAQGRGRAGASRCWRRTSAGRWRGCCARRATGGSPRRSSFAARRCAPKVLARALELLGARGAALLVDRERRLYLSGEVFEGAPGARPGAARRLPRARADARGPVAARSCASGSRPSWSRALFAAGGAGAGGRGEGGGGRRRWCACKGRGRTLTAGRGGRADAAGRRELSAAALAPPTLDELAQKLQLPPRARAGAAQGAWLAEGVVCG